jgi:tetratricopeptide (TPR) repeat protein
MKTNSLHTVAELLQAGIEHHQECRLPQAVEMYAGVLEADPDNAPAPHLLGLAAHQFGRHEEGLKLVECAATRRPDIADFHNSRGVILAALGRIDEAIQSFRHALALDPQCRDAAHNLARMPAPPVRPSEAISERGYWLTEEGHWFDRQLATALCQFFAGKTVADLGAGTGAYVATLNAAGIPCRGYDGNPRTADIPHCGVADLSIPLQLGSFDWVLSLEVGEHIPAEHESTFLDNLDRHNREGIVLSWAVEGQPGRGHVNCRNNDYIKARLQERGYRNDEDAEVHLRNQSDLWWFRNTLMVFRRG